MLNFSDAENNTGGDFELMPAGTLVWAYLNVRAMAESGKGNGYLDLELTVAEGPYARRKMWDMVGVSGSEKYVNIGRSSIKAMLESGNGAGPNNPGGYQIADYQGLNGLKVAIKTKLEKGGPNPNGGSYADKVRPIYLSPSPVGGTSKSYGDLQAQAATDAAPAPVATRPPAQDPASMWGQSANPAGPVADGGPAKPSWL